MQDVAVKDHNRIVKFFQNNALLILSSREIKKCLAKKTEPSPSALLVAASKLSSIDRGTNESIKNMLRAYRAVEKTAEKHPPLHRSEKVDQIIELVRKARSVSDMIQVLEREAGKSWTNSTEDIGLKVGIDIAIQILKEGKENIYRGR
jgi:hypothetical protein